MHLKEGSWKYLNIHHRQEAINDDEQPRITVYHVIFDGDIIKVKTHDKIEFYMYLLWKVWKGDQMAKLCHWS